MGVLRKTTSLETTPAPPHNNTHHFLRLLQDVWVANHKQIARDAVHPLQVPLCRAMTDIHGKGNSNSDRAHSPSQLEQRALRLPFWRKNFRILLVGTMWAGVSYRRGAGFGMA